MDILVAINEFKESLSSEELREIVTKKICEIIPSVNVSSQVIADGGDGFLALFKDFTKESFITVNALGKEIRAEYLINNYRKEAVIEVAEIIGLKHLTDEEKDPYKTTTAGLGKLIKYLLKQGIKHYIIGLGGSATNDCGIGMLTELGYKFTDENGKYCKHGISDLKRIVSVEEDINNELKEASFTIICDVTNPLHGKKGATYVYSKQKGLKDDEFEIVDNYVKNFSNIIKEKYSKDLSHIAGSGAAGGLGYAFLMFTNSNLKKGSNFMIDYLNLEKKISEVDILITGEGKLDRQSFMGKAPIELAKIAKKYNKKVIFLAGSIRDDEIDLLSHEEKTIIDASFSIQRGICTLEKAMIKENAAKNVERTMEQLCALLGFIYEKTK